MKRLIQFLPFDDLLNEGWSSMQKYVEMASKASVLKAKQEIVSTIMSEQSRLQTETNSRIFDQVGKMISPINREVQEQKQHLSKINEMREQIENIQFELQQAATTEQLQE